MFETGIIQMLVRTKMPTAVLVCGHSDSSWACTRKGRIRMQHKYLETIIKEQKRYIIDKNNLNNIINDNFLKPI